MKDSSTHPGKHYSLQEVSALVLAGGQARRMGGQDKGLITVHGKPMIARVLGLLQGNLNHIWINANRNLSSYQAFGHPVISDQLADYQGPLAGIATGMHKCETDLLLVVPCDTPLLPQDLPERLLKAINEEQSDIAVAHDGKRLQPVVALIKRHLLASLEAYLAQGERKIDRWYDTHQWSRVDFSDCPEAFININSPEDKARIEETL